MANATIGITMEGRRVDLSGEISDVVAETIVRQITTLLIQPSTAEPDAPTAPVDAAPPSQ